MGTRLRVLPYAHAIAEQPSMNPTKIYSTRVEAALIVLKDA